MTPVAFRLPTSIVERVDAFAKEQAKRVGVRRTRTDAVRMLLLRGLDAQGRCGDVHGDFVCTMHSGHKGTHYDSHRDQNWK